MNRWERTKRYLVLSSAVALWLNAPLMVMADNASVTTDVVHVRGTWAEEEAKLNPQQVQIITKKEIEKKQAKSVEDIIFTQTGVSRTVDAMGACRCIHSRCRSTSYTDSCRWTTSIGGF